MANVEAIGKILHNGVLYGVGEVIPDLSDVEAKRLIDLSAAVDAGGVVTDNGTPNATDAPDGDMTPKEFASSLAEKQKEVLEEIGIEPASNAEERITQYTEWYNDVDPE